MKRILLTLCLALAGSGAQAEVAPGAYIAERGFGSLSVKGGKFEISSVGANGHTCGLEGEMRGSVGVVKDEGDTCRISFKAQGAGYAVTPLTPEACRSYCGARAYFEGHYLKPAPGCADDARAATQKAFKSAYDAKNYARAEPLLVRQLRACDRTLGWLEKASIRNDLAIAQFHLGRKAACLETLAPLAADADRKDDAIKDDYAPSDWADYEPQVKAARTNLALCRR